VASALLKALIDSTEAAGIWTVQSGIFPENTASLALHQRAGFRIIGTRERIAATTASGGTSSSSNAAAPPSCACFPLPVTADQLPPTEPDQSLGEPSVSWARWKS
jgi:hypothetical protein